MHLCVRGNSISSLVQFVENIQDLSQSYMTDYGLMMSGPCIMSLDIDRVEPNIDGLVQERRNSIANALELRLSCTNPSI